MVDLSNGVVLDGRWRVGRKIGEGACAKVYEVTAVLGDTGDYNLVAKVIPLSKGSKSAKDKEQKRLCDTLYHEYNIYVNNLYQFPYAARRPMKFYGESEGHRYLVMEKLDYDLSFLAKQGNLTVSSIAKIGIQLLDGLRLIHRNHYLFIDVKPDNFMMKGDKLYFVDFGLMERNASNASSSGYGAAAAGGRTFAGTPTYASIEMQNGGNPSPGDEIQAMVYVLLALLYGGSLPWSKAKSDADMIRMKQQADILSLSTSLGAEELGVIYDELRSAPSDSSPDYERFSQLLTQMSKKTASAKPRNTSGGKTKASAASPAAVPTSSAPTSKPRKATAKATDAIDLTEGSEDIAPTVPPTATGRKRRAVANSEDDGLEASEEPSKKRANKKSSLDTRKPESVASEEAVTSSRTSRSNAKKTKTVEVISIDDGDEDDDNSEASKTPVKADRKQPIKRTTDNRADASATTSSVPTLLKKRSIQITESLQSSTSSSVPEGANYTRGDTLVDTLDNSDGVLHDVESEVAFLEACVSSPKATSKGGNVGPFSLRKSELHRARLSSFEGSDAGGRISSGSAGGASNQTVSFRATVLAGPHVSEVIDLPKHPSASKTKTYSIGRLHRNAISLHKDRGLPDRVLELTIVPGRAMIMNILSDEAQIKLNGHSFRPKKSDVRLTDGSTLEMGSTKIVFHENP